MTEGVKRTRAAIVSAIAQALAEIYFDEVCEPQQTSEQLLNTAARMKAIHEAIVTARDLLAIIDKAAEIGAPEEDGETGVVILPEVRHGAE